MPIKGLILLFMITILFAIKYKNEIYEWYTSEISDDYIEDNDNFEEEQEE